MNDATFLAHLLGRRRPLFAGACALLLSGCFSPSDGSGDTDATESGSGTQGDGSGGPGSEGDDGASMSASGGSTSMTSATGDDDGASESDDGMDDAMDDTSDDGSEGSSGDAPDTTAPEIVSIAPDVGALGVLADAELVITFSEAMDTAATEAAFASADLGGVAFAWSDGDTVLTIDPDADLEYAAGTDPAQVVANEYELSVGVGATDLAGNALEMEFQSSFSTLREITTTLASDAALTGAVLSNGTLNTGAGGEAVVGDGTDNLQRKGFFSFPLADLPAGIAGVEQATLDAYQYLTLGVPFSAPPAGLGSVGLDHVEVDALDGAAFNAAALAELGVFSNAAAEGSRTMDVTANVADDIMSGRSHSQYRLEFSAATNNNGTTDRTRFDTQSIDLVYLVP